MQFVLLNIYLFSGKSLPLLKWSFKILAFHNYLDSAIQTFVSICMENFSLQKSLFLISSYIWSQVLTPIILFQKCRPRSLCVHLVLAPVTFNLQYKY